MGELVSVSIFSFSNKLDTNNSSCRSFAVKIV